MRTRFFAIVARSLSSVLKLCTGEPYVVSFVASVIADGTYLFVPDNDRYEGSHRLMFEEHNHPVSQDEQKAMTPAQQARCRWRRYDKAVLLLHSDFAGDRFAVVGMRVLKKREAESTAIWPIVAKFIGSVGPDVEKVLILDRGFLNGERIGELKTKHNVDTVIPPRSDMDILKDVLGFRQKRVNDLPVEWNDHDTPVCEGFGSDSVQRRRWGRSLSSIRPAYANGVTLQSPGLPALSRATLG